MCVHFLLLMEFFLIPGKNCSSVCDSFSVLFFLSSFLFLSTENFPEELPCPVKEMSLNIDNKNVCPPDALCVPRSSLSQASFRHTC